MDWVSGHLLIVVGIGVLLTLLLLLGTRSVLRRYRRILNLPTSACRGIAPGLTELKGTVRLLEKVITSPLAERNCVAYSFRVEERQKKTRTVRDAKGNTRTETYRTWVTLFTGEDRVPFLLEDGTGSVPVAPDGAELGLISRFHENLRPGDHLYEWSIGENSGQGRERRFKESTIEPGDALYVLGEAEFDLESGLPFVHHGDGRALFLITPESEKSLRRKYGCGGRLLAILSLLAVAATIFLPARAAEWEATEAGLTAGAGAVLLVLLLWFWFTYNDTVWLRELVKKAWANIEAELKKRADLVPRLAEVVSGAARHEREALLLAASHRGSGTLTPATAGAALDGQTHALRKLYAVVESYPELKTDRMFLDLMRRLAAVENRLSHLRTFSNDVVESYRNRIEKFPASLVARMTGFTGIEMIKAEEFERAPVEVSFDLPDAVRKDNA